jgi:nucleotide-binding universal stress UspA family protein
MQFVNGDVNAPGAEGVRDYMLRYMAQIFVGGSISVGAGHIAAWTVSILFAFLLLSAVNTAIVDLIAISFLMSRDCELPPIFKKLNSFGVPNAGMLLATVIPAVLVVLVKDMAGLAELYAVGVVGAIATNLGASSTDRKLELAKWERSLMFSTFLVMGAIEVSLFIDKPNARLFALTVLAIGLILRGLASERAQKRQRAEEASERARAGEVAAKAFGLGEVSAAGEPILAAVRSIGRTLDFAIDEATETKRPLYLLYVREQPAYTIEDRKRKWMDDEEARRIFLYAAERADRHTVIPCYAVSAAPAQTIVDIAATVGASRLVLGAPQRSGLVNLLRGNVVREVSDALPENIHLLVYA